MLPGSWRLLSGCRAAAEEEEKVLERDRATLLRGHSGQHGELFVYVATFFKNPVSSALLPGKNGFIYVASMEKADRSRHFRKIKKSSVQISLLPGKPEQEMLCVLAKGESPQCV